MSSDREFSPQQIEGANFHLRLDQVNRFFWQLYPSLPNFLFTEPVERERFAQDFQLLMQFLAGESQKSKEDRRIQTELALNVIESYVFNLEEALKSREEDTTKQSYRILAQLVFEWVNHQYKKAMMQ